MHIHTCPQCTINPNGTELHPEDQHFYHSEYMKHPIEYGISHVTGKRHYHSNSWEADTLQGIRDRIKAAERPVGGYPSEWR